MKISSNFFKPLAEYVFGDLARIFVPVVAVGAGGGLIGLAYLKMLSLLGLWLAPNVMQPVTLLVTMGAVGLAIGILMKVLGNPGDVELLVNNIHLQGGPEGIKSLRSLIPVSLLCIAAGGAAGPEAPLVQTSGTFGTWVAQRKQFSKDDVRILTITGMAAAFTVLFGTPLGSAIFALEILHRRGLEYHEALLPAILGSICGYVFCAFADGLHLTPVWTFPAAAPLMKVDLVWSVGVGIAATLVAVSFTYFNIGLRHVFHQMPTIARPVVGGLAIAAIALWSPYALTFGELQIDAVVAAQWSLGALAVMAVAKFVATSMTISSGWRGGFIIPLFFIGMALGKFCHILWPSTNEVALMAAFMAATNTGVTKTPLGSSIVVTEMAGMQVLPTTLIACIVALLLTSEVGLIDSQRRRDDLTS